MSHVRTFVFVDIETTGIPTLTELSTKITEVALIACSKAHILDTSDKSVVPRVLNKLVLCFNPYKVISHAATKLTGLDNFLLQYESKLDKESIRSMCTFLNRLHQPVCLVAHNGNKFDFPILQNSLEHVDMALPKDLLCVDSLTIFKMIDQKIESPDSDPLESEPLDLHNSDPIDWRTINEMTPPQEVQRSMFSPPPKRRAISEQPSPSVDIKTRRKLFPVRYSLEAVHHRLFGEPPEKAHSAEGDTLALLRCAIATKEHFIPFVEQKCIPFAKIKAN